MTMNENTKKILLITAAVIFAVVCAVWIFLNPAPEHIEDTNGEENYSLQKIRKEDVVAKEMGSRGGVSTTETGWNVAGFDVNKGMKHHCRKFTGVEEIYSCTIFKGSDIYVCLTDFKVKSGNFAFYVVFDGEIVGEVKPDEFGLAEFRLENIKKTGTLEYIIAGESADFSFVAPIEW